MAHGSQVIYFVRLNLLHYPDKVRRVSHITIVKKQVPVLGMRVLVKVIDTVSIKQ